MLKFGKVNVETDSKPMKNSSKNALSATFSAGQTNSASMSLRWLPPL
jgi:hypothetical protein